MANPVAFSVIGSAWRAEFFLRIAQAVPDQLAVAGVLARRESEAERLRETWGVRAVTTLEELLALDAEFVAPAVSWPAMPGARTTADSGASSSSPWSAWSAAPFPFRSAHLSARRYNIWSTCSRACYSDRGMRSAWRSSPRCCAI